MNRYWRTVAFMLAAILGGGGVMYVQIGQFGTWVAEQYSPMGVDVDQWGSFITNLSSLMLVAALAAFCLHALVLHRSLRIRRYERVFELRRPWLWGIIILSIVQLLLGISLGLATIPVRSFSTIMQLVGYCLCAVVAGIVSYWVFTLLYSPPKIRYAPVFRYDLMMQIRKIWRSEA